MLSSKVILVTGACGLLGQQIVREIVEQNGCVLATDTDTDKAKSLFRALPSEQVQFLPIDITDAESVDRAIASGIKQFGTVDACVNAAYPRTAKWGTKFENLEMEDLQENLKLQANFFNFIGNGLPKARQDLLKSSISLAEWNHSKIIKLKNYFKDESVS